jgi:hypothetical protein
VPQLKIEASRLEPGYSETIKNLGFNLGTSEELEDEKSDLLDFEEEVYKNQVNDEYLLDLQIEQSREEAGGRVNCILSKISSKASKIPI